MSERIPANYLWGIALALTGAVGFSFSLVFARMSYDYGTNAMSVLSVRFAILATLAFIWSSARGRSLALSRRTLLGCMLMGATVFFGIGSYLGSIAYLPVTLAVMIFYMFPLITALIVAAIERRMPDTRDLLALAAAFGGLALALGVASGPLHPLGVALAVFAAFGVALHMVGSSRLLRKLDTAVFSFYLASTACALATLGAVCTGTYALPQGGAEGWIAFGLMLITFLIAYLATYNAMRLIGPVRLAMVMNLEPVATILIAVALLAESLSERQIIGGGIVITAIVVAQVLGRNENTAVSQVIKE